MPTPPDSSPLRWIDTHAHLYWDDFKADLPQLVQQAKEQGMERIYMPNVDDRSIEGMLYVEEQYPQFCFAQMGLHPCSVDTHYQRQLGLVEQWLGQRPFSAVGEIGLDYYWSTEHKAQQLDAFGIQLRWARELGLPVVIHARESLDDCIRWVEQQQDGTLRGVFHCFTGTLEQAQRCLELGFYLGIGGVLTYKNSGLAEVVAHLPLSALVLETDSPYLAPVPRRGKRNQPAYLLYVAEALAQLHDTTLVAVSEHTTRNALQLYTSHTPAIT